MSSDIAHPSVRVTEILDRQELKKLHRLGENLTGKFVELTAQTENEFGPFQFLWLFDYIACDGIDSTRTGSPELDFFSVFSGSATSADVHALMMAMFMLKSLERIPSYDVGTG